MGILRKVGLTVFRLDVGEPQGHSAAHAIAGHFLNSFLANVLEFFWHLEDVLDFFRS